jgi:SAM-dependent methyltransferase
MLERFFKKPSGDPLTVSMCGVKLGDRVLVLGGSDTALIAALAVKAGLTGRAAMVDESEQMRARSATAVERDGALIESFTAQYTSLPFEAHAFDVVVMRNVLPAIAPHQRQAAVAETTRVVRPGGRCIVINDVKRGGLASLVAGQAADESGASGATAVGLLSGVGFRAARTLAERDGVVFVEGVKPGQPG